MRQNRNIQHHLNSLREVSLSFDLVNSSFANTRNYCNDLYEKLAGLSLCLGGMRDMIRDADSNGDHTVFSLANLHGVQNALASIHRAMLIPQNVMEKLSQISNEVRNANHSIRMVSRRIHNETI
jgi:hypothetical protein